MKDPVTLALLVAVVLILGVTIQLLFFSDRRNRTPQRGTADAFHLLLEGQHDRARDLMAELIRSGQATSAVYLHMGNLLRHEGDAARALSLHQGLLARSDLDGDTRRLVELAVADDLIDLGRIEEADGRLRQLERHLMDGELFARHATVLHRLGRIDDAAERLEDRARLLGGDTEAQAAAYLAEMARESLREGKPQTARDRARRALKLDPGLAAAYEVDGDRLMAEGRPDKAVEVWKDGLNHSAEGARTFLPRLAEAAFRAGRVDTLLTDLERQREARPQDAALWRAVADLRLRRGDLESFFALIESPPYEGAADLSAWAGWIRHLTAREDEPQLRRLLRSMPAAFETLVYRCEGCGFEDGEPRQACPRCGRLEPLHPDHMGAIPAGERLALPEMSS